MKHTSFALALMLTTVGACDNVGWGGADVAIVPPPPRASGLPNSAEDLAESVPDGPVLFYVVPKAGGGVMVPIGLITGDSLLPLRARTDAGLYAGRFIAAHMRRGAEFALYRNGARVGTFVVQKSSLPAANSCPALPRAEGTLELSAGAEQIPEFLAIAKPHAPEIRRQLDFAHEPTRSMQVIAPILAERMIRARRAELPGNWMRAMAQLKPFPIANARDPGFAATFLVGDELATGGDNLGYSVFFLGVPGAQFGYDTVFVKFADYPTTGKAAPRVVDMLDWNRDGQVDLLLQFHGISDTWFEAVGKNQRGEWRTAFRDRCDRPTAATSIPTPNRPVHTYSIVARDSATGQLGVAVQSHWFSVGPIVPWAEAGVGAVATQSFVDPSYGPLGLHLMRVGKTAEEALKGLLAADAAPGVRQVAFVDARGGVAVHTGDKAIAAAGHRIGRGYSVQANLMLKATVPDAMARAFENARGDLAERMLTALEAAQAEGGDIRGSQSAAILIVSGTSSGKPWLDRLFDLRIEDHPEPVKELRRLVHLARAYQHMNAGDEALTRNDISGALHEYSTAQQMVPDAETNGEMAFWHAVTLVGVGKIEEALPLFRRAFAQDPNWRELVKRLPKAGQLPDDAALIARILQTR